MGLDLVDSSGNLKIMNKEELKMWEDYWGDRDTRSRNALMDHFLPIVKERAEIFHREHADLAGELDDVIMAGIFGLSDSIKAFDSQAEIDFELFCRDKIREAMKEEIADVGKIPRKIWNGLEKIERSCVILHEIENMSFFDIGEMFDVEEIEIKKAYRNAGVKLKMEKPYIRS